MSTHRLNYVTLELSVDSRELGEQLLARLGSVHERRLAPVIDRVCGELSGPGRVDRIERLELELGTIALAELDDELARKLEAALHGALRQALPIEADPQARVRSALELVEIFAWTGNLPWWADSRASDPVRDELELLVRDAASALVELLERLATDAAALTRVLRRGDPRALQRLLDRAASRESTAGASAQVEPRSLGIDERLSPARLQELLATGQATDDEGMAAGRARHPVRRAAGDDGSSAPSHAGLEQASESAGLERSPVEAKVEPALDQRWTGDSAALDPALVDRRAVERKAVDPTIDPTASDPRIRAGLRVLTRAAVSYDWPARATHEPNAEPEDHPLLRGLLALGRAASEPTNPREEPHLLDDHPGDPARATAEALELRAISRALVAALVPSSVEPRLSVENIRALARVAADDQPALAGHDPVTESDDRLLLRALVALSEATWAAGRSSERPRGSAAEALTDESPEDSDEPALDDDAPSEDRERTRAPARRSTDQARASSPSEPSTDRSPRWDPRLRARVLRALASASADDRREHDSPAELEDRLLLRALILLGEQAAKVERSHEPARASEPERRASDLVDDHGPSARSNDDDMASAARTSILTRTHPAHPSSAPTKRANEAEPASPRSSPPPPSAAAAARRQAIARLEEIYVDDAGLVLLWPFLTRLFTRVGLLDEQQKFLTEPARMQAIAMVRLLAFEELEPPEFRLPLAKLLCGRQPIDEFELEHPLAPEQLDECERLLAALIDKVPVLHTLSPASFRALFLRRSAALTTRDGAWLLQVERLDHDLLLAQLPWTWDWVKLPWMPSAVRVEW